MILEIDDMKTIGDIQDRFQECFPLLKIEFYPTDHHWLPSAQPLPSELSLAAIRSRHEPGLMDIKSISKVYAVCKELKKRFGLNVHVFRQHQMQWIPADGDLTLKEQSELSALSNEKNDQMINEIGKDNDI